MILTPCKVRFVSHLCEQTLYSHLAFYVNDQAKTKVFFRLGCIFSDFRFETIIVLAFTVEVMEEDNLFTRFVTVAI